jgi:hypothetical protein
MESIAITWTELVLLLIILLVFIYQWVVFDLVPYIKTTRMDKKMGYKTFRIACDWQESGYMYVKASTLEEAIKKAENSDDPLPDGDYIDGSFQVNKEMSEFFYEEDKKDKRNK